MKKRLEVRTTQHNYDIVYHNSFEHLVDYLLKFQVNNRKVCIVTDTTVANYYLDEVKYLIESVAKQVSVFVFETGEQSKTVATVTSLFSTLMESKFSRTDLIVALGGGVVGDLAGFAAATYLRGIDFIQIPTSLLAQVDSSIGGKTGVDFEAYKNMVGAFYQPILVYMNLSALLSLSTKVYLSAYGEIIKHALIKDETLFYQLGDYIDKIKHRELEYLADIVYRNCEIKRSVVEQDTKEQSIRAILNFGHTIGHAIEKVSNFSLLHGECVAIGSIGAAYISFIRGYINMQTLESIINLTRKIGLPTKAINLDAFEVFQAIKSDKKFRDGLLHFILIDRIGQAVIKTDVREDELLEAIDYVLE